MIKKISDDSPKDKSPNQLMDKRLGNIINETAGLSSNLKKTLPILVKRMTAMIQRYDEFISSAELSDSTKMMAIEGFQNQLTSVQKLYLDSIMSISKLQKTIADLMKTVEQHWQENGQGGSGFNADEIIDKVEARFREANSGTGFQAFLRFTRDFVPPNVDTPFNDDEEFYQSLLQRIGYRGKIGLDHVFDTNGPEKALAHVAELSKKFDPTLKEAAPTRKVKLAEYQKVAATSTALRELESMYDSEMYTFWYNPGNRSVQVCSALGNRIMATLVDVDLPPVLDGQNRLIGFVNPLTKRKYKYVTPDADQDEEDWDGL